MKQFSAQKLLQVINLCNVNNFAVYAEYCGKWIKVNNNSKKIGVCINKNGYPLLGEPCYSPITNSPIVDYLEDGSHEPFMQCIREILLPVYDSEKGIERFNVIVTGDYDKCQEWVKDRPNLTLEIKVR